MPQQSCPPTFKFVPTGLILKDFSYSIIIIIIIIVVVVVVITLLVRGRLIIRPPPAPCNSYLSFIENLLSSATIKLFAKRDDEMSGFNRKVYIDP